jgi:hypothetical protein
VARQISIEIGLAVTVQIAEVIVGVVGVQAIQALDGVRDAAAVAIDHEVGDFPSIGDAVAIGVGLVRIELFWEMLEELGRVDLLEIGKAVAISVGEHGVGMRDSQFVIVGQTITV